MVQFEGTIKTKSNRLHTHVWSGVLGLLCVGFPGMGDERARLPTPDGPPAKPSEAIPWTQLGVRAGANYQGDGLAITAIPEGARLRCVFQRLEGEATSEGLWLSSTVKNESSLSPSGGERQGKGATPDRFRVMAVGVGRTAEFGVRRQSAAATPLFRREQLATPPVASESGVALRFPPQSKSLPSTGTVEVADNLVRFIRPGLVEEYSVSMDGVRQEFVVLEKPGSSGRKSAQTEIPRNRIPKEVSRLTSATDEGALRLELAGTGARVEPTADGVHPVRFAGQAVDHERGNMLSHGARLVLEKSGREIAYSRLRVTDATGKELPARLEVAASQQSLSLPTFSSDFSLTD